VNLAIPQAQRPNVTAGAVYTFSVGSRVPIGHPSSLYAAGRQTNANADWIFYTYVVQDAVAPVNTLIATAQGRVGIGTTSPSTALTIATVPGYGLTHTDGNRVLTTYLGGTADGCFLGSRSNHSLYFFTNDSAARMALTTAGDVGIGTTAPSSKFTVSGNANVTGSLSKGSGTFKIDHPLDPENKYLYHSFVESPDMMNVYNGTTTTDARGYATIELPSYFNALNTDFRYQLTVIDEDDADDAFLWVKVVRKIGSDAPNQFTVRTFRGDVEVSWQVTGVRKDAFAEQNRVVPEVEKSAAERGKYLHPEAFGKPDSKAIFPKPARDLIDHLDAVAGLP
jgi:hypothetical protein